MKNRIVRMLAFCSVGSFSLNAEMLSVEDRTIVVSEGQKVAEVEIDIKNSLPVQISIEEVKLDCSCGRFNLSNKVIKPYGSTKLVVSYGVLKRVGKVADEVHECILKYSGPSGSQYTRFNIVIHKEPPISVVPARLVWDRGDKKPKEIKIGISDGFKETGMDVISNAPEIVWVVDEKDARRLLFSPPASPGSYFAVVNVRLDRRDPEQFVLPLVVR